MDSSQTGAFVGRGHSLGIPPTSLRASLTADRAPREVTYRGPRPRVAPATR